MYLFTLISLIVNVRFVGHITPVCPEVSYDLNDKPKQKISGYG